MTVAYRLGIKAGMLLYVGMLVSSCMTTPPTPDIASDPCAGTIPAVKENSIISPSIYNNSEYSTSVSLSGDTAIVGTYVHEDGECDYSGNAYIFVRHGNKWTQQAKLVPNTPVKCDLFGRDVSIDGDTAVVGAFEGNDNELDAGRAYIFVRKGRVWKQEAILVANDTETNEFFGYSVSISGDTVIVGAMGKGDSFDRSSSVYVFKRNGRVWSQEAKLTNGNEAAKWDNFGFSASISEETIIVGAPDTNCAYIFTRSGTTWLQQQKLTASDAAKFNSFGISVEVSGDTAIIGSTTDGCFNCPDFDGSYFPQNCAYIFTRSGNVWTEQSPKLTSCNPTSDDNFGGSVSIFGDTAIVGAGMEIAPGSAYIFKRSGTAWIRQNRLIASDGAERDDFGADVSIFGDIAFVVAPNRRDSDYDNLPAAAYVFDLAKPKP